ncbi:hypothetical protein [Bacillus sp. RS11]|uniref:hypothetical protein n=1 Tax=Lysinibacillus sp. RS11 TaxID=3242682 RepID=UPI0035C699D0
MFSVRKRSANVAAATGFCLCESATTAATKAAHRTPPGSSARKRSVSGKCFICAKAKRQQQSAQPERRSTPRYGDEPLINNRG